MEDERFASVPARALVLEYHPHLCLQPDTRRHAIELLERAGYSVAPIFHRERDSVGMLWAWREGQPGPERALVARAASRAAVRSHEKRAACSRPAAPAARAGAARRAPGHRARRSPRRDSRVDEQRRVAGDLGQRAERASRRPARRAPSPPAPAGRSPRRARGRRSTAQRVEALELVGRRPSREAHVVGRCRARRRLRAQLVPRGASRSRAGRAPAGVRRAAARARRAARCRFLCGRLAARRSAATARSPSP